MGKVNVRVHRKDQAAEDHAHQLPDGSFTGGQLLKPNSDQTFPHTHLYEHMGKTLESSPSSIGGDHTHITEKGISAGPVDVPKTSSFEHERNDSITRQGMHWIRRSSTGHVIKRGFYRNDVEDIQKKSLDGGPGSGPQPGGSSKQATPYTQRSGFRTPYLAGMTAGGALAGGSVLGPVGAVGGALAGNALAHHALGPKRDAGLEPQEHMGGEEQQAKGIFKDVDEGKWTEAKKASVKIYGQIKWPAVQSIYQNMSGT